MSFTGDKSWLPRTTSLTCALFPGPLRLNLTVVTIETLRRDHASFIGARHDTMDPSHMEMMSKRVQKGRYLFCPNGSHLSMYDDQKTYMSGVSAFLHDVHAGSF